MANSHWPLSLGSSLTVLKNSGLEDLQDHVVAHLIRVASSQGMTKSMSM